jgi:triosephosphate isomerase
MRTKIIAGNWKMNILDQEATSLVDKVIQGLKGSGLRDNVKVVFSPPSLYLKEVSSLCDNQTFYSSAQNCYQENLGAYTGEIAANMIKSVGCNHVILGHSERREYFGETNEILKQKVNNALVNELNVIFCVGELLEDRKSGKYFEVVKSQLEEALFHLSVEQFKKVVIAYEPVWAIGTGETATSAQAQEIHAFIRGLLADKFGGEISQLTSILYGGSCKPANAGELFSCEDVDGGLIGGASLKASDFISIIKSI